MTVGVSCFVVGVVCLVVGVVWLVEGMACCVVGVACLVVGVASFTVEVVCLVGEHVIVISGSEVRTLSGVVSLIFRLFSGVSSLQISDQHTMYEQYENQFVLSQHKIFIEITTIIVI